MKLATQETSNSRNSCVPTLLVYCIVIQGHQPKISKNMLQKYTTWTNMSYVISTVFAPQYAS